MSESTSSPAELRLSERIQIQRPCSEVYRFWRQLEPLALAFDHLETVVVDGPRSHWTLHRPDGESLKFNVELVEARPDQLLAWRSVAGADVETEGRVEFRGRDDTTELNVELRYRRPNAIEEDRWGGLDEARLHQDLENLRALLDAKDPPAAVEHAILPDQGLGDEPVTPTRG